MPSDVATHAAKIGHKGRIRKLMKETCSGRYISDQSLGKDTGSMMS